MYDEESKVKNGARLRNATQLVDTEAVQKALRDAPESAEESSDLERTALMVAAAGDSSNLDEREIFFSNLAVAGNVIDQQDKAGYTALYHAVLGENPIYVQALCNHGANPVLECKEGKTPAGIAMDIEDEETRREILGILLEYLENEYRRLNDIAGLLPHGLTESEL